MSLLRPIDGVTSFKRLITVGRELRQQHPRDLLSSAGTSQEHSSSDVPARQQISRGCCCRNSRPTVISPNYNMIKQHWIKHIYDKIRSKSPPNRATSPTCLHCDVTHLTLTTGVVALYIPSWRVGVSEEQGCTKWRTRRTSPPQADFDRAKKWFQNHAEQTFSPARLINKSNNTYLIILNVNYDTYL